ncbi:MAG TPA: heavy metal translocating P-type ATPase metal-binding domain-containing protein [Chitinophagaceae bacterium]|nr:heavy metal translocating P-type ATPase metal-binding domain-containing protein [Chitinophagaceae bacterium]
MQHSCYHCGENCDNSIKIEEKLFCCEGCKQVFLLLNENDLCNYYDLEKNPGIKAKGRFADNRFAYLDNEEVILKLLRFRDQTQSHVQFHLPTMHCASCIWLLENLHRINPAIISSKTNFQRKEVFIVFDESKISLRKVVELLAFTGYEPYITLNDGEKKKEKKISRTHIFKIGIAGFCFSNIMMLSFPDYFASGNIEMDQLKHTFQYLSLALSLPVLFYSASEFFVSGFKGLRQGWLNIDAPIALAILITFGRSVYEILSATGPGYLDSMSGIVFFMLVGRWFQNRTYDAFSFDRDYKSYFPLGVSLLEDGKETNIPVSRLKKGDLIMVRNEEMIPADGILREGTASIDYSFVSGENTPLDKRKGELLYAGGRQIGTAIQVEVVTPVSQSYITQLWNNDIFHNKKNKEQSFIHPWSRYFTYALFTIAFLAAIYWWVNDPAKLWPSVTAVLIVACPCSLLLSATFTYGNMLSLFGRKKLYLKNSSVIETLGKVRTIVLDKTGTITHHHASLVYFEGETLNDQEKQLIKTVTSHSTHPLSKMIAASLDIEKTDRLAIEGYKEISGKGLEALVNDHPVRIGSYDFITEEGSLLPYFPNSLSNQGVHVKFGNQVRGRFLVSNDYRSGLGEMASALKQDGYEVHILSGDNDQELENLKNIFGQDLKVLFRQTPQDKLDYVKRLQAEGKKVMMLGDGLNDAGALRQADAGIAVTDATNLFSPASDGILDGSMVHKLDKLLAFARTSKTIVTASFILSILYNIVGLSFATRGLLQPMIAAILMPASSISIVIFVSLYAKLASRKI